MCTEHTAAFEGTPVDLPADLAPTVLQALEEQNQQACLPRVLDIASFDTPFCLGWETEPLAATSFLLTDWSGAVLQACTSKQESSLPQPEQIWCKGCRTAGVALPPPSWLQNSADVLLPIRDSRHDSRAVIAAVMQVPPGHIGSLCYVIGCRMLCMTGTSGRA